MTKRKVIIDTDPGIDDILAIATAYTYDDYEIIGMSTVTGNVSLEKTTNNAILTLDILEKDTPIFVGNSKSLTLPRDYDSNVHGNDGMGNLYKKYRHNTPKMEREISDIFGLKRLIDESDSKVTIIALGPLTNIAQLLIMDPLIHEKIEEIHIMGGGIKQGNTTALSEFNFYCDSIAANKVIQSGIKIYLSALDATSQVYFEEEEFKTMPETNKKTVFIKDTVDYYMSLDPYMHDALAVLSLMNHSIFNYEKRQLNVLVSPGIADGMLYDDRKDERSNVMFVQVPNRKQVVEEVINRITMYQD